MLCGGIVAVVRVGGVSLLNVFVGAVKDTLLTTVVGVVRIPVLTGVGGEGLEVPSPPAVVGISILELSVVCLVHILYVCTSMHNMSSIATNMRTYTTVRISSCYFTFRTIPPISTIILMLLLCPCCCVPPIPVTVSVAVFAGGVVAVGVAGVDPLLTAVVGVV